MRIRGQTALNPSKHVRDYAALAQRLKTCLTEFESRVSTFSLDVEGELYDLYRIVLGRGNPKRALLTAGIHGDEPSGVETLLQFLETRQYERYTDRWELTVVPCINPFGWVRNTRENATGVDLNRKFKTAAPPTEVEWTQSLFELPYDLDLELHEDIDSPGYYLYQKEAPPLIDLGRQITGAVSGIMPINRASEIEEMPAENGVLSRLSDPDEMEWWPMALYAVSRGCPKVYTLETGTDFPMETRTRAHLKAIEVAFDRL